MLGVYTGAESYGSNPDLMGQLTGAATEVRYCPSVSGVGFKV